MTTKAQDSPPKAIITPRHLQHRNCIYDKLFRTFSYAISAPKRFMPFQLRPTRRDDASSVQ